MKITKLVILFNKEKIIIGLLAAGISIALGFFYQSKFSSALLILGSVIVINILLAIIASYVLYDKSDLYNPTKLFKSIKFTKNDKVILLHASFDPVSTEFEKLITPSNLKIYNLYGNRHEDEKSVLISNKTFPPNQKEIQVNPSKIPDESNSIDYLFAITSLHEILSHKKKIQFFNEAKRVLKDDGTLIICEQLRGLTNFLFFNIGAFHFTSLRNWKSAISTAGLIIKRKESITIWGTIFFVKKEN